MSTQPNAGVCTARVLLLTLAEDISAPVPDAVLNRLSPARRAKAEAIRHMPGRWRTAAGEYALRHLLADAGAQPDAYECGYDAAGAPVLTGPESWFCSLSHAGNCVAAILSNQPCGIDIEHMRPIDIRVGRHIFSDSDMALVRGTKSERQQEVFFTVWALKESLAKWQRTGISASLRNFSVAPESGGQWTVHHPEIRGLAGFELAAPGGYKMACITGGTRPQCSEAVWQARLSGG